MITTHRRKLIFAIIVLGAFLLRAPAVVTHVHLTPDAIGYLNIARNVAVGRGFVSSIKLHYVDDTNVEHSALSDCPPLYPLLAAGVLRCGGTATTLALLNTLLMCIACGLVFLVSERLFGWRSGLLAGIAASVAPNLFHAGLSAMSDPLALVLALSAVLHATRVKPHMKTWFGVGALIGLATLTRYPCLLIGLALAVFPFTGPGRRRNGIAFVAGLLPAVVYLLLATPSIQALHYCVGSFPNAMWNLGGQIDSLYCLHNPVKVAGAFLYNLAFYGTDLVAGLRGLFLLSLGLLLWLSSKRMGSLEREHRLVLLLAALNLLVYAATWSIPAVKGSRFLLLSYCLLLPYCCAGIVDAWDRWNRVGRCAIAVLCAVTAFVYIWGHVTAATFTGGDCEPLPKGAITRIMASLPQGSTIASNNPWVLSYSAGLPTALLPRNLNSTNLRGFVKRYRISAIVLLGGCKGSETAAAVSTSYPKLQCGSKIALYPTTARTRTKAD